MHLLTKFSCLFLLSAISCSQDAKQTQNMQKNEQLTDKTVEYSALATEYCSCSAELIALNKKAKNLAAHPELIKSPEEMSDLLMESEALQQKQIECQYTLEEKYHTGIYENPDVLSAIQRSCPDLAELMVSAKKNDD